MPMFIPVTDVSKGATYINVDQIAYIQESENGPQPGERVFDPQYGWVEKNAGYFTEIHTTTRQIIVVEESIDEVLMEINDNPDDNPNGYR